jgi:hypothetical protein
MAEFDRRYQTAVRTGAGTRVEGIDQGLRAFMLGIYNNMALVWPSPASSPMAHTLGPRATLRWRRHSTPARSSG